MSLPGLTPQVGPVRLAALIMMRNSGKPEFRCNPSALRKVFLQRRRWMPGSSPGTTTSPSRGGVGSPPGQARGRPNLRLAAMGDQPVDKRAALLELADGDELVGLVGLVDRARSDHHRRDAGLGEQAGLGAERDLGVIALAGKPLAEIDQVGFGRGVEAGEAGDDLEIEP